MLTPPKAGVRTSEFWITTVVHLFAGTVAGVDLSQIDLSAVKGWQGVVLVACLGVSAIAHAVYNDGRVQQKVERLQAEARLELAKLTAAGVPVADLVKLAAPLLEQQLPAGLRGDLTDLVAALKAMTVNAPTLPPPPPAVIPPTPVADPAADPVLPAASPVG